MTLSLDTDLLKAKIFHGLKSRYREGDTLDSRYLELVITECFGFKHVGDSAYYADGIDNDSQLSVKTRNLKPKIYQRKQSEDFQTHPDRFLGPQFNNKQKKWTNGLEIIQRRQQIEVANDRVADAATVGNETLIKFQINIEESLRRYNVKTTWEVICVHGYDNTEKNYILSLFWKEYELFNTSDINWIREKNSVAGYTNVDDVSKKIYERINGNAKRESTCFKEYKDLNKYTCSSSIKLPLPDPWPFDKKTILEEIDLKESHHAPNLFE